MRALLANTALGMLCISLCVADCGCACVRCHASCSWCVCVRAVLALASWAIAALLCLRRMHAYSDLKRVMIENVQGFDGAGASAQCPRKYSSYTT
jgi:hypothetical protein